MTWARSLRVRCFTPAPHPGPAGPTAWRRHFSTAIAAIAALSVHSSSGGMNSSAALCSCHALQCRAQRPIGRHAAADREAVSSRVRRSACRALRHQHVDDRLLKARRQVGPALSRRAAVPAGRLPGRRAHSSTAVFSPLKLKSSRSSWRNGTREANARGIAGAASRSTAGPPGKPRPSRLATLSNASPAASSSVPPSSSKSAASRQWNSDRVPAADDQADAGKDIAARRQPAGIDVRLRRG